MYVCTTTFLGNYEQAIEEGIILADQVILAAAPPTKPEDELSAV